MPCTPTTGLSSSYISQWANLTMLHQSPSLEAMPSLDPIPSPARGRGRRRAHKDENDECHTPRERMSPHPLQPVSSRGSIANARTSATLTPARARPTRRQPPMPNPTLHFRRLAHKPLDRPLQLQRTPSDVTNKQRDETTPSPDLIFNMSPVLGFDGPSSRPYRVASRLSAEPDMSLNETTTSSFLYSYTWDTPAATDPPPPYAQSLASTSGLLADNDHTASEQLADESCLSQLEESELACLVDSAGPTMPRLGRLHAKSDPLPARLSSTSSTSFLDSGARTQPIPIPKPSPRVPSDYGGVSSISMSLAPEGIAIPVPYGSALDTAPRWARMPTAARDRKKIRREAVNENVPVPAVDEEPESVPVPRKKRFFLGESYDGDMDSELSSWRPQ